MTHASAPDILTHKNPHTSLLINSFFLAILVLYELTFLDNEAGRFHVYILSCHVTYPSSYIHLMHPLLMIS